jgi:hypothetical protein
MPQSDGTSSHWACGCDLLAVRGKRWRLGVDTRALYEETPPAFVL